MPSVSYAASYLALMTTKLKKLLRKSKPTFLSRKHQPAPPSPTDSPPPPEPLSLIEFPDVTAHVGIPNVLTPTFHPSNLDDTEANNLRTFVDIVMKENDKKKALFIQHSNKAGAGRTAYTKWFPTISRNMNTLVEKAMEEAGCHPLQLLEASDDDELPTLEDITAANVVFICNSIFGSVAMDFNDTLIDENLRQHMSTIVLHNYRRLAKQHVAARKKMAKAVSEMLEAIQVVQEAELPTIQQVDAAHAACTAVLTTSPWFPNKHKLANINIGYLEGILETALGLPPDYFDHFGREVKEVKGSAGESTFLAKKAEGRLKVLASTSDTDEIERTLDIFITHIESCDTDLAPTARPDEEYAEEFLKCGDLGVDAWQRMSVPELQSLLLFHNSLPPSWPRFLREDGKTTWMPGANLNDFTVGGPGFKENALLWHQLVGVAAIVSKMWTAEPTTSRVPGTLLADGVGVGKTAQIMASIAFVQSVWELEQNGKARPPIIKDLPCFMGKGMVPDSPHLIIVPTTLVGQWHREVQTFFRYGFIDVYVIPTNAKQRKAFFTDPSSKWVTSGQAMARRIVICSHSTFTIMAHEAFHLQRGGANVPLDNPRPQCVHVMTATPLFTKHNDLCNMARMTANPAFCGPGGLAFEKSLTRQIESSKRATSEEVSSDPVRATKYSVVKEIQSRLGLYVIRRTLQSTKPDGSPLNSMPPVTHHNIFIRLSDGELRNLDLMLVGVDGRTNLDAKDFDLKNFWMSYRTGVVYYVKRGKKYPVFNLNGVAKDGTVYDPEEHSKIRVLIHLILHLLSDDRIPHPIQNADNSITYPEVPASSDEAAPKTRKILIYAEFTMIHATLASIFAMNDIEPYCIHGNLRQDAREKVVQEFVKGTDPRRRVLIFSGVGAAGLNLSCADVVFLLDACWSQVQIEQIIGRAAHLTQEKPVHVYHLLALGTTDLMMTTLAKEKGDMLDDFFSRERNAKLEKLLSGDDDDDGTEMYEVKGPSTRGAGKSTAVVDLTEEDLEVEPSSTTPSAGQKKKAKGKKKKSPEVVVDSDEDTPGAVGTSTGSRSSKTSKPSQPLVTLPDDPMESSQSASTKKPRKSKKSKANVPDTPNEPSSTVVPDSQPPRKKGKNPFAGFSLSPASQTPPPPPPPATPSLPLPSTSAVPSADANDSPKQPSKKKPKKPRTTDDSRASQTPLPPPPPPPTATPSVPLPSTSLVPNASAKDLPEPPLKKKSKKTRTTVEATASETPLPPPPSATPPVSLPSTTSVPIASANDSLEPPVMVQSSPNT
ncbi:hypothetical protein ONZ45_g17445 [Pleurotus djamor]|nr:hypothetical protein ONZ45_g17445 [Pleurotus djamor]